MSRRRRRTNAGRSPTLSAQERATVGHAAAAVEPQAGHEDARPGCWHAAVFPASRQLLFEDLVRDERLGRHLVRLVLVMAAGAALYGAALGAWHGGRQALYAAVKLPLVLVLTSAITLLFNWLVATLLGLRLGFVHTAVLTFLALATASLPLASLAPIAWFFTISLPPPSTDARLAHNLLYLLHTAQVGGCGLAGAAALWQLLRRLRPDARRLRTVFAAWLLTFALAGGEVGWSLRPFVGSVYEPTTFLRRDALEGNVYEFVLTDIAPYLLQRLGLIDPSPPLSPTPSPTPGGP
jgi:hypothetical protein